MHRMHRINRTRGCRRGSRLAAFPLTRTQGAFPLSGSRTWSFLVALRRPSCVFVDNSFFLLFQTSLMSLFCRVLVPKTVLGLAALIGAGGGMSPLAAGELAPGGSGPRPLARTQGRPAIAAPEILPDGLQTFRKAEVRQTYAELPLGFEPNRGQAGKQVRFLSRGPGYSYLLLDRELVFQFQSGGSPGGSRLQGAAGGISALRMRLVNGKPRPGIRGENRLRSKSHYLRGTDPGQWRLDVPTFSKVRYQQVYPGIDLIFYGNGRRLEFDFRLDSGVDPGAIRLRFEGMRGIPAHLGVSLDEQGNLILPGGLRLMRPLAFQEEGGVRQEVRVQYELGGNGEVGFRLGAHDPTRPLVIDPVLTYSAGGIGGACRRCRSGGERLRDGDCQPRLSHLRRSPSRSS